ncbi:MAG TPA: VWA domain-containing protein [Miltoncostaeaceae bacterium]|nr:VWA domain-containing protein [Miltoncostaeaceae bacterium]
MSWPVWQAEHWLWALLVIPVLAAGYVLWTRSSGRAAARWADPAVMRVRPPARTRWMRAAAFAVALLAVAAGIVAMARPSVEATGEEQRSSVMLTLDVSDSMEKTDIQPSRLAAAIDAAERFVDAAPEGTSVGVTTFADRASVVLAPTKDRDAIHAALGGITQTREGTALGAAVTTSLAALQANGSVSDPPPADPSDSPGRLLVLTDGANSIRKATSPEAAAERAAAAGVPVYTILLGDDPGRPDQPLPSETLSAMANRTGGLFAQSTTAEDLQAVFADIGSIVAPVDELRELTVWFAAGAAALLLLAAVIAGLSRPRPPRLGGVRTA